MGGYGMAERSFRAWGAATYYQFQNRRGLRFSNDKECRRPATKMLQRLSMGMLRLSAKAVIGCRLKKEE